MNILKTDKRDVLQSEYLQLQNSLEKLKNDYDNALENHYSEYDDLNKNTRLQNEIAQVQSHIDGLNRERLELNREEIRLRSESMKGKKKGMFSRLRNQQNLAEEKLILAEKIGKQLALIEEQVKERSVFLSNLTKIFAELKAKKKRSGRRNI